MPGFPWTSFSAASLKIAHGLATDDHYAQHNMPSIKHGSDKHSIDLELWSSPPATWPWSTSPLTRSAFQNLVLTITSTVKTSSIATAHLLIVRATEFNDRVQV